MWIAPLLDAPLPIQLHTAAAVLAFLLGIVQLAGPKGTVPHRIIGWTWAVAMMIVAVSSFFISHIRQFGPFSLIHLLSIWTIAILPLAILAARRGRIGTHRKAMISLFAGALVLAGALTFLPGRLMHKVVMGL